jgi:putative transposase
MPRVARTVFAGLLRHITERGNRREDVFFDDDDRQTYLDWLGEYVASFAVEIVAYCLVRNRNHLILIPATAEGLQQVLKPLHMRDAQRFNRASLQQGHIWQGRFSFDG